MIVKNRKTGIEYMISPDDWEKIVEQKKSGIFVVVDKGETITKKQMPIEIEKILKTNTTKNEKPITENRDKADRKIGGRNIKPAL